MRKIRQCRFASLEDQFNFGRYRDLSLADVLDINPSYLDWCVKHCTGVIFQLDDRIIEEIKTAYPRFFMDALFESRRIWNLHRNKYKQSYDEDNYDENDEYEPTYEESPTFEKYAGSWAQDVEGYSDDDIDTLFDGDPSAYWNID